MIEITRDLSDPPPTYDQTQDKNLPTYDEVTTASNLSSNEGVTNFGATSEQYLIYVLKKLSMVTKSIKN